MDAKITYRKGQLKVCLNNATESIRLSGKTTQFRKTAETSLVLCPICFYILILLSLFL